MNKNILRQPEARTALIIAAIAAVTVLMLILQTRGVISLSLQSNAVYNPLPGYGPLRQDYGADQNRQRRRDTRRTESSSSSPETVWFHRAASSSSVQDPEQARRERRQRAQYRQWQRSHFMNNGE